MNKFLPCEEVIYLAMANDPSSALCLRAENSLSTVFANSLLIEAEQGRSLIRPVDAIGRYRRVRLLHLNCGHLFK